MSETYAKHLAALHAGFEAPPALIAAAARDVTTSPIAERERIVHGEANEVYRLAFASGLEVILRIARRDEGLFEKEAWAIGRCRALGVAAPEVLSIQRRTEGPEPLELCFLDKLPGQRLSDSLDLPEATLRAIAREIGDHVSRIHTIRRADLGEGAAFFLNDTDDTMATAPEFLRIAAEAGLDISALERALRDIEQVLAQPHVDSLTHNDFRACHVLVHEGRLSGLIDFGQVSMDSPANDLAKWEYWEAPAIPAAWLAEGYGDGDLFDADYTERFATYRLINALWALRWYALTGYSDGAQRAATRIAEYLAGWDA